jgi:hypothetical protein
VTGMGDGTLGDFDAEHLHFVVHSPVARLKEAYTGRQLRTPSCFPTQRGAALLPMTPATKHKPTDGALRAAKQIERNPSFVQSTAEIIDRETGVRELVEMLENIVAEAGDLIESRSPELVAQARAAVRHYADEAPRQAE